MRPLSGHSPERRKEGKNRDKRVREEEGEVGTSYLCLSPLACSSLCPQAEREPMLQAGVFCPIPRLQLITPFWGAARGHAHSPQPPQAPRCLEPEPRAGRLAQCL